MWHKAGTISVTTGSSTVTGVGTGFVGGVRTGDGLQAPDGRFYEIVNVASDTTLSIEPAYMGPTEAGKDYWIVPVPGYTKGLADQVAQLLRQIGLLPGDVEANTQDIARLLLEMAENTQAIGENEGRIANAEQAMLTKTGSFEGLEDLKKSQLNLGVIQSLAGEVFSTDNCTIIENKYGVAFRNPKGLQLCVSPPLTLPYSHTLYLETTWRFPAVFSELLTVQATFRGNGGNQINWPDPYRAHIAYATTSNAQTNVALYPPTGRVWASNSSATGVFAFSIGRV